MKQLILDHYRRWFWVLALVAALEFGLGWFIAAHPEVAFEFWAFLLALWTSAILLNFDLQRGLLRPVAVLPLTGPHIGRSWWVATVPIPSLALAALLFLGAGTCCYVHPNPAFPAQQLVMASLFTLVWLGIASTMIFVAATGLGGSWRQLVGNFVISAISIVMFFGSMVLGHGASKSLLKSAILLGVGGLLTGVGWVRAQRFDPSRAGLYLGRLEPPGVRRGAPRLTPLELRSTPGHYRASNGYGGLWFLLSSSVVRILLYVAAIMALSALPWRLQGQAIPSRVAIITFAGTSSLMACGFIIVFQLLPVLRQLRFLRTLPISAFRLATVLMAIGILPLMALGAAATAVAGFVSGTSAVTTFLSSFTFSLAPAALCVFFAVWRGESMLTYALLLVTVFGLQQVQLRVQSFLQVMLFPFSLAAPIAAASILVAFLLTYLALRHSSYAYRVRASPFGNFPLGTSR